MTKKFGAQRRAAFLRTLAETGNQTLAAERAKVSRSWVTLHRAEDPAFRAAIEAAVAAAKVRLTTGARLAAEAGTRPPSGWATVGGAELVVRGTNGRRVQIARSRLKQWDPGAEDRFIASLGTTCNVKAACAAAGLTPASAYNHRKRWPAFQRRWDAAVEQGYVQIEAALIANGGNIFSGEDVPAEVPMPAMTVDQALQLLHMHKREVRGVGGKPGLRPRLRTMDEVRDGIVRKVEAIKRARSLTPEAKAEAEAAWAAIGAGRN